MVIIWGGDQWNLLYTVTKMMWCWSHSGMVVNFIFENSAYAEWHFGNSATKIKIPQSSKILSKYHEFYMILSYLWWKLAAEFRKRRNVCEMIWSTFRQTFDHSAYDRIPHKNDNHDHKYKIVLNSLGGVIITILVLIQEQGV